MKISPNLQFVMTGQIFHINRQRDMYSIRLSNGDFSVIETNEELEPNETVSGNLDTLGFTLLKRVDSELELIALFKKFTVQNH